MVTGVSGQTNEGFEWRIEAAARIAAEVRLAAEMNQTRLTKVTSLLHAFRTPGTPARFREVQKTLEDYGVEVASGWPTPHRPGVLKLSIRDANEKHQPITECGDSTIQTSEWRPNGSVLREHALSPHEQPGRDGVVWFNVDPPLLRAGNAPFSGRIPTQPVRKFTR
jgi:hypothetical protein